MNRLVRDHYPVSKLPEDLRAGFEGQDEVRVTIDVEAPRDDHAVTESGQRRVTIGDLLALRTPPFLTATQIDDHLSDLRDEWD